MERIKKVHTLTPSEEHNLSQYLEYLFKGNGKADVDKFIKTIIANPVSYLLTFIDEDLEFEFSETSVDMNEKRWPTDREIYSTVKLFFKVLCNQKGKLNKEQASYYYRNYTGYDLGALKGTKEEINRLRFLGCYKYLKRLPSDGYWDLVSILKKGELPSLEFTY